GPDFYLSHRAGGLFGMVTGIGGGMMKDGLLGEVPHVLKSDLYAGAAPGGAIVVVVGHTYEFSYAISAPLGGALCFGLRFMAIRHNWHLPTARLSARERAEND